MVSGEDKRKTERINISTVTYVRKNLPGGGTNLMEFRTKDLSLGGLFISTDDLSTFQIGEPIEIMLDDETEGYKSTTARVVRGARVFTTEGESRQTASGYGLMFFEPDQEFIAMLSKNFIG
ncbi:MAG: PilZ domain-containing protein [Spirochaetota bacterium]